jgi:hypothetical protein
MKENNRSGGQEEADDGARRHGLAFVWTAPPVLQQLLGNGNLGMDFLETQRGSSSNSYDGGPRHITVFRRGIDDESRNRWRASAWRCGVPTKAALGARPRGAVLALGRGRRRRRARVCGYEVFAQGKERDWIGSKDIYTHTYMWEG